MAIELKTSLKLTQAPIMTPQLQQAIKLLQLNHLELADVVVDASDNFATRFALNQACVRTRTPLVSGAAIRSEGQLSVFDFRRAESPCYRCLYSPDAGEEQLNCSEAGVLAPITGVVGSLQALEVVKLLSGYGEPLTCRLLLIDGATMDIRTLRLGKDPACPVCGAGKI